MVVVQHEEEAGVVAKINTDLAAGAEAESIDNCYTTEFV